MNVTFFGDLFEAGVAIFELSVFGAELVVVFDLGQHACIRTGNSGEAEDGDSGAGQENIEVLDGDGDLAKLTGFVAGYEKYVKTFTQ